MIIKGKLFFIGAIGIHNPEPAITSPVICKNNLAAIGAPVAGVP